MECQLHRKPPGQGRAEAEVVDLVSSLIRFDTSNTGELATTKGERECAEWVAAQLQEVGYETAYVESGAPGRGNVFARLKARTPTAAPSCCMATSTSFPPSPPTGVCTRSPEPSRTVTCGGRGAVDMKDMVGMILAVARQFKAEGIVPPPRPRVRLRRRRGGRWQVRLPVARRESADLFEGVTEAVGEVGGFSLTVPRPDGTDRRLYLVETAEKGLGWMRLTAKGRAGHGSFLHTDNAVTILAQAVARLGAHTFPLVISDSVAEFLEAAGEETGLDFDPKSPDLDGTLAKLGTIANIIGATLRDTANPTMLSAGYKANVIPQTAEAVVDCRILPGRQAEFEAAVDELIGPDVQREWITKLDSYETTFDGHLVDAMNDAILAHDPGARTVPYMLSGGTDAKAFAKLGIRCFGFAPLQLPADLDFSALFHGVDERVPVDALLFGTRVLEHFLLHS